jgi:hypothetical protein
MQLTLFDMPETVAPIKAAFDQWDEKNPQVYENFKEVAFELMDEDVPQVSGWYIINILRWRRGLRVPGRYVAYLSRKFIAEYPYIKDFLTTAKLRGEYTHDHRK